MNEEIVTVNAIEEKSTTTDIKVFENEEFGRIRTIIKDDEPWFVGKDVAAILGYSNTRKALIDHVDEEDKNTVTIRDGNKGNPNQTTINESGLYSLILSSKLPSAKKFKRWVTSEVLPSIRKTGGYINKGNEMDFLTNPESPLYSYFKSLTKNIEILQQQIMSFSPVINTKALNIWKKSVAVPLINEISDKHKIDSRNAYDLVYDMMSENCGFSRAFAIIQFCDKYHCEETSVINAIADNPVYQGQFVRTANRLIHTVSGYVKQNSVVNRFTTKDDFDFIIHTVAERLGDRSCNSSHTYSKGYAEMSSKQGWKNLMTRHHTRNKKSIILSDKKKFSKFVDVCNKLITDSTIAC